MIDLTTEYLGLHLKNPLIASASPLSRSLDSAKALEDSNASAIVMFSLFEEEIEFHETNLVDNLIHQDIGHAEADSYLPLSANYGHALDDYLEQLQKLKQNLEIPVIASLNGVTPGGWLDNAKLIQDSGADALELNMFMLAQDFSTSSAELEDNYIALCQQVVNATDIPVAIKLSSQFTALPSFVKRLEASGVDGIVMFNRFYQPDIDPESLRRVSKLTPSTSFENLMAMRWISMMFGEVALSISATSGINTTEDVVKLIMAGADTTQLCSALLKHGPGHISTLCDELSLWLDEQGYSSLEEIRGRMSLRQHGDLAEFSRANYIQMINRGGAFKYNA